MKNFKVGILGATGYTGVELLKLLRNHPAMSIDFVTSERLKGQTLKSVFPFLYGPVSELQFIGLEEALKREVDGVFSCLPHKTAVEKLAPFFEKTTAKIVDLSADFRLNSAELYESAYCPHLKPELLEHSLYGLCDYYGAKVADYRLIGNPGCYPTSILLPTLPLVKNGLVEPNSIIADSKSGVSGAGKEPTPTTHFCEVHESFAAYKVGDEHRHLTEINEQLSEAAEKEVSIIFTPHLVPMKQGILSTIYMDLKEGVTEELVRELLNKTYSGKEMVEVMPSGFPKTAWVRDTNCCVFGLKVLKGGKKLVIVSAIDNLIKGASGQALQNMNIVLGLEETLGLK